MDGQLPGTYFAGNKPVAEAIASLSSGVFLKVFIAVMVAVLFCVSIAKAAHLKGGYIEYAYLGKNTNGDFRYRITVYQYLDCGSGGGQIDTDVNLGIFKASDNTRWATLIIPLSGTQFVSKGTFTCIVNPPTVCYRIDSYTTIAELPKTAQGYVIGVQRCCRISGVVNVAASANTGITYTVNIPATDDAGNLLENASPEFAQQDTALVCANNYFEFPFRATDPDGDSLVYRFTSGQGTPSSDAKPNPPLPPPFPFVRYNPGFSADLPLGNRVNINATTGLISGIAPTAAGDYVVTVFVDEYRNGDFISSSRKELHVSVGNCDIPRALLPERIIQCKTFSVDFENNSTSAGINSYWWDFGVAARKDDVSQVPKPTYTYPDTGVYRAKLVVNREGACPDSMTTEVRIFPGFEADFGIDGICIQLPYRFSDSSRVAYGRVNRWRWDFGITTATNDTAITANAQYAYANTGGYTIKLVASSDKGCTDSITKQLTVNDKPTIGLAFRDTLICSIDSLQLWASGSGNFSWTPGTNMLNANTASPTVFPKDTITYHVTLFDRGCVGTDSVRVNVLDFITVDAGRDTAICRTDGITLRPVSFATTYQWSPGVALSNTTIKNPVATPTDSITTYYVTANLGRCQDRDSISIRTVPYPVVNAGTDTTICFGQTAFLRGSTNTANYTWSPTTALQNPRSLQTAAAPRQSTTYRLTAWNTAGCTKPVSDDVLITVTPQIVVHAGRDTSLVLDQPLQLTGNSSVPQVVWTPAVGLNATNSLTPIVTIIRGMLPADQEFLTYNLAATSPNGCTANDEVRVRIFNTGSSIFVPSAFTPNRDGKNDIIKPILAGMRQLEYFRVYNRYGQLIYETRAQGQGWDGTLNGQPQPSSAFVYHCQAVDYTGKPLSVQGTFMLVR